MKRLNLRELEIFRAVMVLGTTVRAADELSMSQPAVSNALKTMEARLGFTLFERAGNRLDPTDEARLLHQRAEPVFQLIETVNQSALDIRSGSLGRVRVVATSEVTEALMPIAMSTFLSARPDVHVTLDTKPLHTVLEAVESGLADVGFAMDPGARTGLLLQPIESLRTVCVCVAGRFSGRVQHKCSAQRLDSEGRPRGPATWLDGHGLAGTLRRSCLSGCYTTGTQTRPLLF